MRWIRRIDRSTRPRCGVNRFRALQFAYEQLLRMGRATAANWLTWFRKNVAENTRKKIDAITCCVWSCDTGKINASDKIMFENQKKTRKYGNIRYFYINLHRKDLLDIEFNWQLANASWCQRKRWHHLSYLTHIDSLRVRHSYWGQKVGHT